MSTSAIDIAVTEARESAAGGIGAPVVVDLDRTSVRELNQRLHRPDVLADSEHWRLTNPGGRHSLACGLNAELDVEIEGHAGYFCAGMNQLATVVVHGNAGVGLAENMMSGTVRITGNASQSAGATAHGGLLVIEGDASARCGISMKGVDIVVGGSIGHRSAFMAQAGRMLVRGDAGESLGDSIYETRLYIRGTVASLGADCVEKSVRAEHLDEITALLTVAGYDDDDPTSYRRYGSARELYHFKVDNASSY